MPYLILADRQGEFDRRELREAVVIGRSPDCTICVRDILLSRKHCRIEPLDGNRWVIEDLGSKNGTRVGAETVTRHVLGDGEVIRIGKIHVSYHGGAFVPATEAPRRRDVRPTDPKEALSGTVLGFQLFDMEEDSRISGFPIPKPRPAEPARDRREEAGMVVTQTQAAPATWDGRRSQADVKARPSARPLPGNVQHQRETKPRKATRPEPVADAKKPHRAAVVVRDPAPDRPARIPAWLAWTYILLACTIGGTSLGVIVMKSILSLPAQ